MPPRDRQRAFARRLGFSDERILWDVYTCDHPTFASARHPGFGTGLPKRFLFVGGLSPEKGTDILAEAYASYRSRPPAPWPLVVCGTGPMGNQLSAVAGVEMVGLVRPPLLPSLFARSGCLVQPSRFETGGIAIHEATSVGLAVICTGASGASTRLILDDYNGKVGAPGNSSAPSSTMSHIAGENTDLAQMGARSAELARQFTPERWARYLVDRIHQLRRQL